MADLFGAPLGIIAAEEGNRQNMLAGVQAQKLLGDIAMQPSEARYKDSLARLHSADALGKENEAAAAQQMMVLQQDFVRARQERDRLVDSAKAQGRDATIADLNADGRPKSQADALEEFADFAEKSGAPPLALEKTRKMIAEIKEKEAIGADHAGRAETQRWTQREKQTKLLSNTAAAAAESPANYLAILSNSELRALLPQQLTGDWTTDQSVLKAIAEAGQDALARGRLEQRQLEADAAQKRHASQNARDEAVIARTKEQERLTRLRANDLAKNGGPNSPEARAAKRAMTPAQEAAAKARDLKLNPPLILDPKSRVPGQTYRLGDGRIVRWEVNPATGKYGLNVLGSAPALPAATTAAASTAADNDEDEED